MDNSQGVDSEQVKQEFESVREFASQQNFSAVKDGSWFVNFLHWALEAYTREVNADYFKKKYPGLPADALVDLRINLAARYAGIGGGVTAGIVSALFVGTIGSGGGASPATIPLAAANVLADVMWTSRLQLRLAWDLAVLYRRPIDINDPEDLYELFNVAFGVKAAEAFKDGLGKLGPEAVRQGVKAVASGARLQWLKALPVVGRYLLQRNLIKFAIPLVNVPLSAGLNYYSTRQIGKAARAIYRDKISIKQSAERLTESTLPADLLLETVYFLVRADSKVVPEEAWLLRDLAAQLDEQGHGDVVARFELLIDFDEKKYFGKVESLDSKEKGELYEAAVTAASIDHQIHKAEVAALKRLSSVCETTFDAKDLARRAKPG